MRDRRNRRARQRRHKARAIAGPVGLRAPRGHQTLLEYAIWHADQRRVEQRGRWEMAKYGRSPTWNWAQLASIFADVNPLLSSMPFTTAP